MFALLRLFGVIWIFGFIALAASATSSYLFSSEVEWEAVQKWNGVLPQYMMDSTTPFINLTPGK